MSQQVPSIVNTVSIADGSKIVWKEHIPFNANEVLDKRNTKPHKIEELGHNDARKEIFFNNVEKFNQDLLTPTEVELLNPAIVHVNQDLTVIERLSEDAKNNITKRMYRIGIDPDSSLDKDTNKPLNVVSNEVESIFSKWKRELTDAKGRFADALYDSAYSLIGKDRQLKYFQVINKLEYRDAIYPKSHILHFAFILVALVGEALLNAYFYSQGSDLGLLGGWLQALMVSAANVILSFIIGFVFLRYLNHVSILKKILAGTGLMLSLSVLGFLHLAAAHYRELLIFAPDKAATLVLTNTMNFPFQLNDIDSFIMIIVGVGISMFIFYESYCFDDSYPGYGEEWRIWLKSEQNLNYSGNVYRDETKKIMAKYENSLSLIENNLKANIEFFTEDENGFSVYQKNVKSYVKTTVDECTRICNFYRKGFNAVAGYESLVHDDKLYNIIKDLLFTKKFVQELDNITNITNIINSNKSKYMSSVKDIRAHLNNKLNEAKEYESNITSDETEAKMREQAKIKAKGRKNELDNIT
jgi:hypothetical protein